jgi:hypothetical protein
MNKWINRLADENKARGGDVSFAKTKAITQSDSYAGALYNFRIGNILSCRRYCEFIRRYYLPYRRICRIR